ncbi:MAG: VTT domain-containing protein [Bythopirellula sp.]|nr:VTT domain-containing protein [Bythopirellula sp.]
MTSPLTKPLLLVALVLVLPLVLLAFTGESFSAFAERVKSDPPSATALFLTVVAILATDIFLPVPSGPISTLAGSQLGIVVGTSASTLGLTLGGIIAFALARRWGRPLAERFANPEQLTNFETAADTHGLWLVIITRPLPILAEAAVLLVGTLQMSWRTFLPTLIASNLLIAATYAFLGQTASERGWLPAALCLSIALPILVTYAAKRRFRN